MNRFLSCDWGTSSFRLRLVDADKLQVPGEVTNSQGIAAFFDLWKQSGQKEDSRISFYQAFIKGQIIKLEEQLQISLLEIPLIISGMASSRIGMVELPYKKLPFNPAAADLYIKTIKQTAGFNHTVALVSGARTDNDVMRGEETQLTGCQLNDTGEQLFIFPGTHSKHVLVKEHKAVDITTYMTGEFFSLLSTKSILSGDVEESMDPLEGTLLESFQRGVIDSLTLNLLHSSFLVRSHHLLGKTGKKENYYYLSGLLIGTELKELKDSRTVITLVSNNQQKELYQHAFGALSIKDVIYQDADAAIVRGHGKIYPSIF